MRCCTALKSGCRSGLSAILGGCVSRVRAAGLLIFGGFLGFLPVLGFWMVPLGLVLLAVDLPALQPPLARLLHWIERKWPHAPQEPK
jgi:fatty acid desaturase